jgi:hypothetical protein
MTFIILTFLAAFLIEGLGTATSVIGLSALFGANPIIIALAIALDLGKIVVVSLLYKYWSTLGKVMKSYAFIAAAITMVITSAGAAGYLTGEFQKAIMGSQESGLRVEALKGEQAKLEERKKQIDNQIEHLPEKYTATARIRMINQFKDEQKTVTARLGEITTQLPDLQVHQLGVEAKAGPILTIAKSFNIPVEQAIKYVILMIIVVFDPLAIFLIIAGNFLVEQRKKGQQAEYIERIKDEVRTKRIPVMTPPPPPPPEKETPEPTDETTAVMEEAPVMPIYEVLEPTPQPLEEPPEPPEVKPADPNEITLNDLGPRAEITLDTVKGKLHRSSMHDADEGDVEMDVGVGLHGKPSRARTVYQGQRR